MVQVKEEGWEQELAQQSGNGLYRRMMSSLWTFLTTGEPKWAEKYEADELAYQAYLANPRRYRQLCGALAQRPAGLSARNWRALHCLRLEMMEQQAPIHLRRKIARAWSELAYTISTYRAQLDGRLLGEQEVLTILAVSRDEQQRQAVWAAWLEVGKMIAPKLLALIHMRNELARCVGYDNYHDLKLAAQELEWKQLWRLLCTLRERLAPLYRDAKAEVDEEAARTFRLPTAKVMPWHYRHPFFQQDGIDGLLPPQPGHDWERRLVAVMAEYGLAIGDLLAKSDLYSRTGKSPASFCLHLDRAGDVRISAHLHADGRGLSLLLHEMGHAAYEIGIDRELPFVLRQPAHTFLSEAVALLFERLASDYHWLKQVGVRHLPERECLERWSRRNLLIKLFWTITVVLFERELYLDPDKQLNNLWWELAEEVQGLNRPDDWDKPYWAAKAHFSTLPVYYHNYLLGEVAAAQLQATFALHQETWPSKQALQRLQTRLFAHGASLRWDQLVAQVCGEALSAAPLIRQLATHSIPICARD